MLAFGFLPVQQVQVQASFAMHLANGVEPREVFQDGRIVARGLELTETANGGKHFFSHAESTGGTTEVESWLDAIDQPIKARYSMSNGSFWATTTVELHGNTVEMRRTSSQVSDDVDLITALPKGTISLLAQFDPLKLLPQSSAAKSLNVSIIDAVSMTVANGMLAENQGSAAGGEVRTFDLSTQTSTSRMVVSGLGKVQIVQNSEGQTYKPVPWNDDYLDMARRAGIRLDAATLANIRMQSWSQSTQPTLPSAGVRRGRG